MKVTTCIIYLLALSFCATAFAHMKHPKTNEPLVVVALRGTPTIDGDLADWKGAAEPAVIDSKEQLFIGQKTWDDADDCGGKFYVLWDDEKVYVAAEVTDDKIVNAQAGGNIWKNDCEEIFFAQNEPMGGHNHYQFGFTPSGQSWLWCGMAGESQQDPTKFIEHAASETATGYILESSIEISHLEPLEFVADATLGFHCVLDDTDNGTERELQITWTGLEAHDQSQGFGDLILSAEPMSVHPEGKLATTWGGLRVMR